MFTLRLHREAFNVEVRKIWCDIDDAEYVRERLNVPGCQILMRVDREVFRPDGTKKSHDSRFFISSLDPGEVTPEELLCLVRKHWQVENCLHWVKDRWWDEDKHYSKHAGNIFVELTNAALSLLRLMKKQKESLSEMAENVRHAPKKTLKSLGY
ncbi:MAG: transposase [Planctomycetaceae bacterium]|nr:transposase [Planctomycetaceae bacterium]